MTALSRTRIVGNKHNRILTAAIEASTQRASSQLYLLSQQRAGNGRMVLTGPYSGAEDSIVDVEVLGGSGGALRASSVVINGVGNGTLDVQSIDVGAAPQTLSFTLLNSGTNPKPALLDFFGVQLAAKAEGVDGNSVEVSVVRDLTFTDLPFATLEKLLAGSTLFDGPQYDWGATRCHWVGHPNRRFADCVLWQSNRPPVLEEVGQWAFHLPDRPPAALRCFGKFSHPGSYRRLHVDGRRRC